jgi:(E)-4-hydroxy-3-methylbut-2-enyl-diphosphate synthase
MTDLGITGGGAGRHMVYSAGKQDHTIDKDAMIDHVVEMVETRAAALRAADPRTAPAVAEAAAAE